MRMRKYVAVASAALLGAGLLTSCSGQTGGDASAVELYVFGYDAGVDAWADETSAAFDALDLGYTLNITVVPANDLQQTLTTRLQGGTPPDISSSPTAWLPSFAGSLRDLSGVLSAETADGIDPTVAAQATIDGKLVAAPYGTSTRGLYYNTDAFAAAGIDQAPATWDDLIADGLAAKQASGLDSGIAIQGKGNETFAAWFPYVYWSFGGDFGTGNTIEIDQNTCETSMQLLQDMVLTDKVTQANPASSDLPEIQDAFISGTTAMTVSGPWLLGSLEGKSFGVAPLPAGTTQSTLAVADAWATFTDGKASDKQVGEVLEFLLSPEIEVPFLQARGFLPSMTRDFADPAFQTDELKQFVDALPTAKFAPLSDQWAQLQALGETEMQSLYLGESDAATVCGNLISSLG
jgi:multiple sugar transport system substrate-binding protein